MSSGSTSNYSFTYPVPTDPVNVAGDIKSLADTIDAFLTAPAFINNIAIDGGSLITDSTTANLFNINATTINIGGAATSINIGSPAGQTNFAGDINVGTGKGYEINNVSVLNSTTLGPTVINSSLTSLGTIVTGVWNATTIAVNKGGTGVTTSTGTGNVVLSSSPTLTGTPLAPTATSGTNTTQIATTSFVQAAISSVPSSLPSQSGQTGNYLTTDGSSASWTSIDFSPYATLSGATFTGLVSVISPTSEGSKGVREITMSTLSPTGGLDGDVWLVYS